MAHSTLEPLEFPSSHQKKPDYRQNLGFHSVEDLVKVTRTLASAMLAMLAIGAAQGTTQAQSGGTYSTGLQVVNMENNLANVTITFYDAAGNDTPFPDTIAALGSKTYFPLPAVSSGFSGSAVVSSDRQIAAVLNMQRDPTGRAAYVGVDQGSTEVLIPLLLKNHGSTNNTTFFKVQNAGTANATVNVAYTDGTSGSATVVPGAAATFDQGTESHPGSMFAGKVTSNEPVVVTVVQENSTRVFAYGAFPGGTTAPVIPLVNVQPAKRYATGIQVQNGGSTSTDVTLTYYPSPGSNMGTECTETKTIAAGASANFALAAFSGSSPVAGSTCIQGQRFIGSAKVTANSASQPLVAIVNQQMPDGGSAYGAFNAANATNKVVFPLIKNQYGSARGVTGFNVMNVGASATNVSCVISGAANGVSQSATVSAALAPGQALSSLQSNVAGIDLKFLGSATCTATGGDAKIVGVINESAEKFKEGTPDFIAQPNDKLFTSEGVNAVAP